MLMYSWEVTTMNQALITQLKILRLSNIKPNFSELARLYDMDRRKSIMTDTKANLHTIISQAGLTSIKT